jgi:membrane protein implicated in regulation of membrane protease activity
VGLSCHFKFGLTVLLTALTRLLLLLLSRLLLAALLLATLLLAALLLTTLLLLTGLLVLILVHRTFLSDVESKRQEIMRGVRIRSRSRLGSTLMKMCSELARSSASFLST